MNVPIVNLVHDLSPAFSLLAQNARLNGLSNRFSSGGTEASVTTLLILLGVLVAGGLAFWMIAQVMAQREGQSFDSPRRLFNDLCKIHQLDWRQRFRLRRLARARRLMTPSQLFLDPAFFNRDKLDERWEPHAVQLAELQQRIFHGRDSGPKE